MIETDGTGLVFILSTPRAGSTLLGAILGSHPEVLCPPEPWLLLPLAATRSERILATAAFDYDLAMRATREFLTPAQFDNALRAFATSAYNAALAGSGSGKRMLVDKTPRYYQILSTLSELFPHAAQIWIKRNPLDTIVSSLDMWHHPLGELLGEPVSPYTFDVTISFALLADHFANPRNRKLAVRYEDLVRQPESEVQEICQLLNLEFEPAMLEYGANTSLIDDLRQASMGDKNVLEFQRAHPRSIGRWKSRLSAEDVRRILSTLGTDLFRALDYPDQLREACRYAAVAEDEIPPRGRLPELQEVYERWGIAQPPLEISSELSPRPDIQYTLLGRRTDQLQQAAEERLHLIHQLDDQLRALRVDVEQKELVIEGLQGAANDRLQLVERLHNELSVLHDKDHGAAVRRVATPVAPERLPAPDHANQEGAPIERLLQDQGAALADLATSLRRLEQSSPALIATSIEDCIRATDQARATAESVADLHLALIQDQERTLESYRRWRFFDGLHRAFAPRLGVLYQYPPRALRIPTSYLKPVRRESQLAVSIVTPTRNQAAFIERTFRSVLDQRYSRLEYIVQDGASTDGTLAILDRYADRLTHSESAPDSGFANAINRAFAHASGEIMAYLNSDDLLLPNSIHYIARFFEDHPDVDVVYGHRAIIDEYDAEIGRWVLPPHDDEVLSWADYVPQETLFWRRRVWDKAGAAIDESFRFAIDWDLLLRFREVGARMVRVPRFIGAFRVHPHQKTSADLASLGLDEMNRLRMRCHMRWVTAAEVQRAIQPYLRRHVWYETLYSMHVLRY